MTEYKLMIIAVITLQLGIGLGNEDCLSQLKTTRKNSTFQNEILMTIHKY